jgi:asparagine synthase (glutamine-hydrolysing)
MARNSGSRVKTFSIGFDDRDFDELEHARAVARKFDTDHHELVVEPDVVQFIEEIAWYLDEPFGDSSAIPSFMVSKLASEHVKVLLSGDGGDEIFAGYDRYLVEQRERQYGVLPAPVRAALGQIAARAPESMPGRNFLRHFSLPELERYLDASTLFAKDEKKKLFRPESFEALAGDDPWRGALERLRENRGHWLSAVQRFDLTTYLPLDILTKVDRTSMAHSIEVRAPLLDHELVEFAARIPPELQLRDGTTKHLFKRAMRGILPDSIIDRPKHGFAVPLGRWFRGTLSGFVRELLLSQKSTERGIFEPRYVERLIERHEAGRPLDLQIWTLMSFELWCRTFLDRKTAPAFVPPAQLAVALAPVAAR